MVFYYTTSDGHLIYMGRDKYENEDLIKYGWEEDLWFHVDNLSSAHVYLRMKDDEKWDQLDEQIVMECCQLVKENSIQGCKASTVKIVYTPWSNLNKTNDMEIGAIGFKDERMKRYVNHVKKDRDVLKVLKKTEEEEKEPDFIAKREARRQEIKAKQVKEFKEQQQIQQQIDKENKKQAELRNYDLMMDPDMMKTNKEQDSDDDFM